MGYAGYVPMLLWTVAAMSEKAMRIPVKLQYYAVTSASLKKILPITNLTERFTSALGWLPSIPGGLSGYTVTVK